jgi:serine/threonine-protein kinase HipA
VSALGVWMNGRYVGEWLQLRDGRDSFRYAAAWRDDPAARALSLSLPLTVDGTITSPAVRNYFENLLPDDPRIRERLRRRFGARSVDAFDLLATLGRDCVGAVQLLPEGATPDGWDRIDSTPLTPRSVEKILEAVPTAVAPVLGGVDEESDSRISIAGGQEKTALLRIGRTWHRPRGATPTSHILKLPLGVVGGLRLDLSHSVDNEWLCTQLLAELGLPVARTEIGRFGGQRVLIVERFDRRWQGIGDEDPRSTRFAPPPTAWLARLPQEDFCQATGVSHESKYEAHGGPGVDEVLSILARADQPQGDRRTFALAQAAFWMLAAVDGHAKNFSLFHRRGGGYGLTPLYDVLSAWPVIGQGANRLPMQKAKLAMSVPGARRRHYALEDIQPRHFEQLAQSLADPEAWPAMLAMARAAPTAIDRVERRRPSDFAESVWERVTRGLRRQGERVLAHAGAT